MDSLESIPGLLKRLQIRALLFFTFPPPVPAVLFKPLVFYASFQIYCMSAVAEFL